MVLATSLTTGSSTSTSSATTASISPTPNRLVLVVVNNCINLTTPNTPTVSGASMTWTQVATSVKTVPSQGRISIFRALTASPGSGALTLDFGGQTQEVVNWMIAEFSGVVTTGTNGADAIVQAVTDLVAHTVTSHTTTLAALDKPANASYGAIFNSGGASVLVPGSGYTEIVEVNNLGVNVQHQIKSLGSTTVDWTFVGSNGGAAIGLELNANVWGGAGIIAAMV